MATITKADIAATINRLRQSGRSMPQMDRLRAAQDVAREALAIFQETVDLWWDCFGNQSIGIERWKEAEKIALTMPDTPGVLTRVISTNLMGEALRRAESQYLEAQRTQSEEVKRQAPIAASAQQYTKAIYRWICQMMGAKLKCTDFFPTDLAPVLKFAREHNMGSEKEQEMRTVIRMVLATQRVCATCQGNCPFEHRRPAIMDGALVYQHCGRL